MLQRLNILLARRPRTAEAWLARMARPGVGARDQAALLAWLEADPDHLRQYRQTKADQAALEPLKDAFADDLAALRSGHRRPAARRSVLSGALAGGVIAAAVGAVFVIPMMTSTPEARLYESAPGRITDIALDDGSRMTLDAGSAVRVALGRDARRATLERGAAYFDVAHDTRRPFQVAVADRRVIVTGTRFVTALAGDAAQVSLLQGRVAVSTRDVGAKDALNGALILSPGERADFRWGRPGVRKADADVDMATAWRQRRLVFQDAPLSQVIASAARYGDHPLILADPALGRTRVTLVVPLEGLQPLEQRLTALLPIRIETADDGRRIVRRE
ncbi:MULTISPECIES: FecR family protein [unclassified Brevundimonas]|uniref:FecR family protein n=1 Tax=unclassified Brevundimonas TaxID=2622653 RepID=UPI002004253A|nr:MULTISPECIES: FecR domain-containing protein [unclassified Brevundimonas]MCK6103545.1 FecR domain-containing protein [Brevundimonas sp. EYE_349]